MILSKDLDILLITYNRKKELQHIVSCILAENSPIKNCNITFLDNHSTDGTSEYLRELAQKYKNIIHIRHKYNISGNANIIRAMETVDTNKKYFWILCDDDHIDWTHWTKVQIALESNQYDIIQVFNESDIMNNSTIYPQALSYRSLTFLPAGIYKTKNITDDVIFNAYMNIYSLFPHWALIAFILNQKGKIFTMSSDKNIVTWVTEDLDYTRGSKKKCILLHPILLRMNWHIGFLTSLELLKDNSLKKYYINTIRWGKKKSFFFLFLIDIIAKMQIEKNTYGLNELYRICPIEKKIQFILLFPVARLLKMVKNIIKREKYE